MNVLVLGARVIAYELAEELIEHFLKAAFFVHEERHLRRLHKILAIEKHYSNVAAIENELSRELAG